MGYIWGWDIAGFFYGIYRNAVVDTAVCVGIALIMYVLFVPRRFLAYFGIKAFDKPAMKAFVPASTAKPVPKQVIVSDEAPTGALINESQQQSTTTDA